MNTLKALNDAVNESLKDKLISNFKSAILAPTANYRLAIKGPLKRIILQRAFQDCSDGSLTWQDVPTENEVENDG